MSKYTTEVRFICETEAGKTESTGYNDVNSVIALSRERIFNFDYPIYDEAYRPVLETKILKHYYTREIGMETYGLWKLRLDAKMNEIMPYYNLLYKSALMEFNPLVDIDFTRTGVSQNKGKTERTRQNTNVATGETTGSRNEASVNRDLYSDTPQNRLGGLEDETYLTNARKITDSSDISSQTADERTVIDNGSDTSDVTSVDDYIERVSGKTSGVSTSRLLLDYRKTLINIDMMIIDDLSDLFMQIW